MRFTLLSSISLALSAIIVCANPLTTRSPLKPTVHNAVPISPTGGGTYPRLALVNGDILGAFIIKSGSTNTLTVTRSTDGGSTWSPLSTIAQSAANGSVDNPFLIQLPNKNVVATFRNHDRNSTSYTYFRITAYVSTDSGATWKFLSHVDQRAKNGVNGLWEPFARNAKSGKLQVYYSAENSASDQNILMRSSSDGGATWGAITTVANGATASRDGMPGCADFTGADGVSKLLCVFETTEGTGHFNVKSVLSTDDGVSFGNRRQVYVPIGSANNAGAPSLTCTTDGTLVVSFMTDEDTSAHNWTSGANMKILTSNSVDPQVWGQKTTVFPVQADWPSVQAKTDGSILACAAYNGAKCSSVTFA